jgi:hypothetical protein
MDNVGVDSNVMQTAWADPAAAVDLNGSAKHTANVKL